MGRGVNAFFSLIHVPREEHAQVLARIASWLRPGGWFVGTLGVDMYRSGWGTARTLDLVRDAGFVSITATEVSEDEDGKVVTHLWVVAQRPLDRARAAT